MWGQVGHVPGEGREKSMGREGLHAPSPQGVLHAWKRWVGEIQLWLVADTSSAVHADLGRTARSLFSHG